MHIENLYRPKAQVILNFKKVFALEKIHGTSAHITFKCNPSNKDQRQLVFFSGGESYDKFINLFDKDALMKGLIELGLDSERDLTIYGEAYGGSQQGMSGTYGKSLKFIAFDVQIGNCWLSVPEADALVTKLGLEFVYYTEVSTDLASLDAERDGPSIQAIRNGVSEYLPLGDEREKTIVVSTGTFKAGEPCWYMGKILLNPKKREGVVIRPLVEMTLNNSERVICKHKGDDFKETATVRKVVDPTQMKVLEDANAVANEWVTANRLEHVLDKIPGHDMTKMRDIISAMIEDVLREGSGEIVESEAVSKSIGKKTVEMYKAFLKSQIKT